MWVPYISAVSFIVQNATLCSFNYRHPVKSSTFTRRFFPPSKSKRKFNYFPWPSFSRYTDEPTEIDHKKMNARK